MDRTDRSSLARSNGGPWAGPGQISAASGPARPESGSIEPQKNRVGPDRPSPNYTSTCIVNLTQITCRKPWSLFNTTKKFPS